MWQYQVSTMKSGITYFQFQATISLNLQVEMCYVLFLRNYYQGGRGYPLRQIFGGLFVSQHTHIPLVLHQLRKVEAQPRLGELPAPGVW